MNRRFRWVVCQLDSLRKCRTAKEIRATLRQLPKTLDDTYIRILKNINENDRGRVDDILNLIAFSKRPLKLKEIVEAIAFDAEKGCFDEDEKLGDPLDVLEMCSSLISLAEMQTSTEVGDSDAEESIKMTEIYEQEVRFAHFSVKEFLIDNRSSDGNPFHISD